MCILDTTMTTTAWIVKRFIPVLLVTVCAAIGLALFRASEVFLIGLQGMAAGGLIGWLAGRLGRGDMEAYWSFSQRCWLGASMMVAYVIAHLVTLSILNAGPVDTPLYWLGEMLRGFQKEEFASAGRFHAVQGKLEGGWWIFMNALDAGLFWLLFNGLCKVGICPDRGASERGCIGEFQVGGNALPSSSNAALYAMLFFLAGMTAAGGLYWKCVNGSQHKMTYSAGIAAMKQYEGQWRFTDGDGLIPDDAESRSFTIAPIGPDSLLLKGSTDNFRLSLSRDGQLFEGLLFILNTSGATRQLSARVRFSHEHDTLTMSVVNFEINGRRDIVLKAERIDN